METNKDLIESHHSKLVELMCEVIGVDANSIDLTEDRWYCNHTWSEDEYNQWFEKAIDYIKDNQEAQGELMKYPSNNKEKIKKVLNIEHIGSWAWNYGWKMDGDWNIF